MIIKQTRTIQNGAKKPSQLLILGSTPPGPVRSGIYGPPSNTRYSSFVTIGPSSCGSIAITTTTSVQTWMVCFMDSCESSPLISTKRSTSIAISSIPPTSSGRAALARAGTSPGVTRMSRRSYVFAVMIRPMRTNIHFSHKRKCVVNDLDVLVDNLFNTVLHILPIKLFCCFLRKIIFFLVIDATKGNMKVNKEQIKAEELHKSVHWYQV